MISKCDEFGWGDGEFEYLVTNIFFLNTEGVTGTTEKSPKFA